jgi:hypothetical protein
MKGDAMTTRAHPRQLSEQQSAVQQLRALAKPYRFRVQSDVEGFPIIPGRYGQIEWFDGRDLAVYTNRPHLFAKLWGISGVRRHQTGDAEMRALFAPEALEEVATVIRAKRWGGTGRGRPENFHSGPGQVTTSRPPEPRLPRRTGLSPGATLGEVEEAAK